MSDGKHKKCSVRYKKTGTIALWVVLFVVFLYPFWCLGLNKLFGWGEKELYTFGLELKDFITVWIALGGIVGVTLNIFLTRTRINKQEEQFNKQYVKQVEQIEVQQKQLREQEKQGRDARFASGMELLGNPYESTRIGGAYNLYFLARDFEEYRETVCEILCAHIRTIAAKNKFEFGDDGQPTEDTQKKYPKNEVQSIVDLLFRKFEPIEGPEKEQQDGREDGQKSGVSIFLDCDKDLREVFLWKVSLNKADELTPELKNVAFDGAGLTDVGFREARLFNVDFWTAELTEVDFVLTELKRVMFGATKLTNIRFVRAKLTDVNFFGAKLFDVDFSGVKLDGTYDFLRTALEDYSYEEIVKPGRSKELTAEKDEEAAEETTGDVTEK